MSKRILSNAGRVTAVVTSICMTLLSQAPQAHAIAVWDDPTTTIDDPMTSTDDGWMSTVPDWHAMACIGIGATATSGCAVHGGLACIDCVTNTCNTWGCPVDGETFSGSYCTDAGMFWCTDNYDDPTLDEVSEHYEVPVTPTYPIEPSANSVFDNLCQGVSDSINSLPPVNDEQMVSICLTAGLCVAAVLVFGVCPAASAALVVVAAGVYFDAASNTAYAGCDTAQCAPNASVVGDPNFVTLDGLYYAYQGAGEYDLVTGDGISIQARFQSTDVTSTVSQTTAVAVEADGNVYSMRAGEPPKVQRASEVVANPVSSGSGAHYKATDFGFELLSSQGDYVRVQSAGSFLDVHITLPEWRKGKVSGLLGNYDGNPKNEFQLRDGTTLQDSISNLDLYGIFGNSWRIEQANSRLPYRPGESTLGFTDLLFPLFREDNPQMDAATAADICNDGGVTAAGLVDGCIHDVMMTGDPAFVEGLAEATPPIEVLDTDTGEIVAVDDLAASPENVEPSADAWYEPEPYTWYEPEPDTFEMNDYGYTP